MLVSVGLSSDAARIGCRLRCRPAGQRLVRPGFGSWARCCGRRQGCGERFRPADLVGEPHGGCVLGLPLVRRRGQSLPASCGARLLAPVKASGARHSERGVIQRRHRTLDADCFVRLPGRASGAGLCPCVDLSSARCLGLRRINVIELQRRRQRFASAAKKQAADSHARAGVRSEHNRREASRCNQ